jgi:hypothetical protein
MGCCGHDFPSTERIAGVIKKNTLELKQDNPRTEREFISFRDRRAADDLRSGVCRNLVEKNGCFLCPLHPAIHGKDLREGHCDINYLCKSAILFEAWGPEKKAKFLSFIESKKLNNLEYSVSMDKGTLLKEFVGMTH